MTTKYKHSSGKFARVKIKLDQSINQIIKEQIWQEIKQHVEDVRNTGSYQKVYIHCSVNKDKPKIVCIK